MLWLTRWFGVTASDAERDLARERSELDELVEKVLLLQSSSAKQQNRSLRRGTHAKGVCARAQFEVLDVKHGREPELAARLAKGIFAKPGVYPAIVRFGNADPKVNSDFKPDVRSLSFSVDLTRSANSASEANGGRQDFSLQNAPPLPINDAAAFLATMKLLTASNPAVGLWKSAFQGQATSSEGPDLRAIAIPPEKSALSATTLLEQRTVSSRAGRGGDAVGHTIC